MTQIPCQDVDYDEARNVPITQLITKYKSSNILINKLVEDIRNIGKCHLLVDESEEASKSNLPKTLIKKLVSKVLFIFLKTR